MDDAGLSPGLPAPQQRIRTLSYLFLGGGVLGFVAVGFFPLPSGTNIPGTWLTVGLTSAFGLLLLLGARRLPPWITPIAVAVGTLVVSLDIYFAGDIGTNDEMFFIWVAFYAFYFLRPRIAALQLVLVGITYAIVITLRHEPDASTRWVILMGTLSVGGIIISKVVTELGRWARRSVDRERALREAEDRFRSAFDEAAIGMALVDLEGQWLRVNEALARLTGYAPGQLIGKKFGELTVEEDLPRDLKALEDLVAGRIEADHTEKRYRRADGNIIWISLSVSVVRDALNQPLYLISQMQDISDRKAAESELARRALHDPLTGLPNRLLFVDRVSLALARMERSREPVAVFFIDLDRFKLVNDSLGHSIGDRMLTEVAERVVSALRPSDTVSRFGGDEFTVLCENIDEHEAAKIARRIQASLSQPFRIGRHELFATASVGASIARDAQVRAEAMLRDADVAMYRAKEHGRSRFVIFDGAMHAHATEKLELENDLRRAVERDELRLLYQPLVELATGKIFGVEALIRWQHPRRGMLSPGEFIHIAEESELIVQIGEWVLGEACRQARAWQEAGRALSVSINLSPRQLAEPSLTDTVAATLTRTRVDPSRICLEITESAAVDAGIAPLSELRELGVRLALDDFGTGFSSLNQVHRLPPVDVLKIDRSFVENLGQERADEAVAAAIIGIAGAFELSTVAEGVENQEHIKALRALGCTRGQGFFFSPPVSAQTIDQLLELPRLGQLTSAPRRRGRGHETGLGSGSAVPTRARK